MQTAEKTAAIGAAWYCRVDALGAVRIPDPTTAGDFLRRLDRGQIDELSEAINVARTRVWKKSKDPFFDRARSMSMERSLAPRANANKGWT